MGNAAVSRSTMTTRTTAMAPTATGTPRATETTATEGSAMETITTASDARDATRDGQQAPANSATPTDGGSLPEPVAAATASAIDSTDTRQPSATEPVAGDAEEEEDDDDENVEHDDDDGHARSLSEAESAADSVVTVTYKRKKRRPAVTHAEDLAILRAITALQPHRAARGELKRRWTQVVEAVVAETGSGDEVTRMLCQRRYEILLSRFLTKRALHQSWPDDPEMRALLESAAEERKEREEGQTATPVASRFHSLPVSRAALHGEAVAPTPRARAVASVKQEAFTPRGSTSGTPQARPVLRVDTAMDDLFDGIPSSHSPTRRRAYVESTVVAVLDRLADMEKTWLESAREERALKLRQLELEKERRMNPWSATQSTSDPVEVQGRLGAAKPKEGGAKPAAVEITGAATRMGTSSEDDQQAGDSQTTNNEIEVQTSHDTMTADNRTQANGTTAVNSPTRVAVAAAAEPKASSVSPEAIVELKNEVAILSSSVIASQQTHKQLTEQVATLSSMLDGVRGEKDVLKQDGSTLQALLRDVSSLAGALRLLRDSHQEHERKFGAYTQQQHARIDALRREVKEQHQAIRQRIAPLEDASGLTIERGLRATFQRERVQLQAEHDKQLAHLDEKLRAVEGPIAQLQVAVDSQQKRIEDHEQRVQSTHANHVKIEQELREIKTELENDRNERLSEYSTLVETIEQVAAGTAKLI